MNAIYTLAIFAAEQLIRVAPPLFLKFQELIAKKDVTIAELQAERHRIAAQTYEELVPHSKLPPGSGPIPSQP